MKVLKNGIQRNVVIDKNYYTEKEMEVFEKADYSFTIYKGDDLRIDLDCANKIEVVYDKENGRYANEVVLIDGSRIKVLL